MRSPIPLNSKQQETNVKENRTPRTLFLDIGGVLLTNGWDRNSRMKAAELFDLDYEDMNERHHLTYDTYESGKISLREYLDRVVFCGIERKFSFEDFRTFMFGQSKAFPIMIELVRSLKRKYNLKVGVISNEGKELNEYRISNFGLREFVDFFISSSFVHMRKPDRDIYQMALDVAQVSPEESVYVDDREMFVQIAEDIGLKSVHHTTYEATREALAKVGLAA